LSPAEGARQVEIEVRNIVMQINRAAVSRGVRGVNLLRSAALEVLGQDGNGRRYGRHVASAPGQPPAPDTGNLRRNWRQKVYAHGNGMGNGVRVHMQITSQMEYDRYQEFGTRFIAPRPHRERIKTKARPEIVALFASI